MHNQYFKISSLQENFEKTQSQHILIFIRILAYIIDLNYKIAYSKHVYINLLLIFGIISLFECSKGHCTDFTVDCIVYTEGVSVTNMHAISRAVWCVTNTSIHYMIESVVVWCVTNTSIRYMIESVVLWCVTVYVVQFLSLVNVGLNDYIKDILNCTTTILS